MTKLQATISYCSLYIILHTSLINTWLVYASLNKFFFCHRWFSTLENCAAISWLNLTVLQRNSIQCVLHLAMDWDLKYGMSSSHALASARLENFMAQRKEMFHFLTLITLQELVVLCQSLYQSCFHIVLSKSTLCPASCFEMKMDWQFEQMLENLALWLERLLKVTILLMHVCLLSVVLWLSDCNSLEYCYHWNSTLRFEVHILYMQISLCSKKNYEMTCKWSLTSFRPS